MGAGIGGDAADGLLKDRALPEMVRGEDARSKRRRTSRVDHLFVCWRTGARLLAGFFRYYPSRRQQPAAPAALMDALHL